MGNDQAQNLTQGLKNWLQKTYSTYWPNFIIGLITLFLGIPVAVYMTNHKGAVYGIVIGFSLLAILTITSLIYYFARRKRSIGLQAHKEPTTTAEKPTAERPPSINQTMSNSPGGIQNTGSNVNINQGRLRRELTEEKRAIMSGVLNPAPKNAINIDFAFNDGEAHTFAVQLVNFLNSIGWRATLGSPSIEGTIQSGLGIFVQDRNLPGAGALQLALERAGFPTSGSENPELPKGRMSLFVGSRP